MCRVRNANQRKFTIVAKEQLFQVFYFFLAIIAPSFRKLCKFAFAVGSSGSSVVVYQGVQGA